ncbi:hypothetical protein [Caulobacter sp. RHG1]|uniref:hypothetical protein n=1 Tax=Caulobacter sp. (strain RHG1) TaxID=2545762 RepID=UPI0015546BB4|nr:hypothetical protein [Caulobacter sp. RHG1]NQE61289.1 hypothetical protein [Caulobacter sp. RHG1]
MSGWSTMLGGLAIWLLHFGLVYAVPSLDAIRAMKPQTLHTLHDVSTASCFGMALVLVIGCWRGAAQAPPEKAFRERLGSLGAAVAAVAILFQAAPDWIGRI